VAAGLLTSPSAPAGPSYPVVGAVLTLRDIIATFGRVLGRDVRYEEISDEEWRRAAAAKGVNQHAVEHLSSSGGRCAPASQRAAFAVTDTIETLGGAKPKTFEAFVRDEQRALTAEAGRTSA